MEHSWFQAGGCSSKARWMQAALEPLLWVMYLSKAPLVRGQALRGQLLQDVVEHKEGAPCQQRADIVQLCQQVREQRRPVPREVNSGHLGKDNCHLDCKLPQAELQHRSCGHSACICTADSEGAPWSLPEV